MPYSRPTLTELRAQVASDIESNLSGSDALLRFSNLRILGTAQAGLSHLHYGYLDWIAKQAVPYTATDEYLEAWGALKNVTRKSATASTGTVSFTGTPNTAFNSGLSITAGDGTAFVTTAAGTISAAGTATVAAQASATGTSGNISAGVSLTLSSAVSGVNSIGSAATDFTGGADQEDDDDFRVRVLDAYQAPPQGGAKADYVTWAEDVAGVTRAWCSPNGFGAGTVVMYIMLDDSESANSGFPNGTNGLSALDVLTSGKPRGIVATGDQLTVANSIYPNQPVTAMVYVCAPIPNWLTFTVSGLSTAGATVQSNVTAAISDVLVTNGDPRSGTVDLSDIQSAVTAVSNTDGFLITKIVDASGNTYTGNITSPAGYLPVLQTVNYLV